MTQPGKFISTSDFPTIKADPTTHTASVTIPSSVAIAASGTYEVSADVSSVGTGALTNGRISSTKLSSAEYLGTYVDSTRNGTTLGTPATYQVFTFVWRPNASTLRLQVVIHNPYADPLIGEAGDETITFFVQSFVPPFTQ